MSLPVPKPDQTPVSTAEFLDSFEKLEKALPEKLELPSDLTRGQFGKLLRTLKRLHKRTALYWGQCYREAVARFGEDAYQLFDWWDYSEQTLQNYARVVDRLAPELWNADLPDRHLLAITQNVDDYEEQGRWVNLAREQQMSGDDLRKEIHRDHEERGLRTPATKVVWNECQTCHGKGGWIVEEE